jgi:uncharacterized protein
VTIEVMWNQQIDNGTEHLVLSMGAEIQADGLVVGQLKEQSYRIQYRITCDKGWNVQAIRASNLLQDNSFSLTRREEQWLDGRGQPMAALRGCTEVDIMVTPFTNTLPIRRLKLEPGQAKNIVVIYVRAPDLNLARLEQRYTCLSRDAAGGVYRYENLSSNFTSELQVDSDGLVVDYPGYFKMAWKKGNG